MKRKERVRREKIRRGVRRYWKRVKRLAKSAAVNVHRARRLYRAGAGRPKKERVRRGRKPRARIPRVLWKGNEFMIGPAQEALEGHIAFPAAERHYILDVLFKRGQEGELDYVSLPDELEFHARGEAAFWGEYWTAAKDWQYMIEELYPAGEDNIKPAEWGKSPQADFGGMYLLKISQEAPRE